MRKIMTIITAYENELYKYRTRKISSGQKKTYLFEEDDIYTKLCKKNCKLCKKIFTKKVSTKNALKMKQNTLHYKIEKQLIIQK